MRAIPKITTRQVNDSDDDLGYIGELLVDGERIFACGGTNHDPTMLVSNDGGETWEARSTPKT